MWDATKLVHGDILYFIGTGDKVEFLEFFIDKDGEWRGKIKEESGKIKKYHVTHFTHKRIFTQDKSEINNRSWLRASQQDDGLCWMDGCGNVTGHKRYCNGCKEIRAKRFKLEYYKKMGWNTSKLEQ